MTNNKQQTAVEWLVEKINEQKAWANPQQLKPLIKQAKEMEKQEMKHWFRGGMHLVEESLWKPSDKFEEIYNEIYGGNK
jgi:hypothetical protein